MFVIKLADLPIGIDTKYSYTERISKDYITEETPIFTVSANESEIEEERKNVPSEMSDGYLESIVICRKISNELPKYDATLFHCASFRKDGRAYAVTAESGTGKTTHMRLWLNEFNGVEIINGDKPILRIIDGKPYLYGSPWQGKENYGQNTRSALNGIAFLKRGAVNKAYPATEKEALLFLTSQIHFVRETPSDFIKMAGILNAVIKNVKLYNIECNMEAEAAHVVHAALAEGKVTL